MSAQYRYISNEMTNLKLCPFQIKTDVSTDNVNMSKVSKILKKKYISAQEMQAISCLFQSIFTGHLFVDGVPSWDNGIKKWINKINLLSSGAYGEVLMADIVSSDSQVIIKRPLATANYEETLREYFIGITGINKLRYYIPNFVYTMGAFQCGDIQKGCIGNPSFHIVYEKVPGKAFFYAMNGKNFEWFLNIYVQILLALEVAQREISFSHYDLHTLNVMIKNERISYDVLLDNVSYSVSTDEYPVIIDFGRSCIEYKDKMIGAWGLEQLNVFPFCVQGVDLGNFLASAYNYNNDSNMKIKILKLSEYLDITIQRPCMSSHFNISPLDAVSTIMNNPEYMSILTNTITVKQRDAYVSLKYQTPRGVYDDIFNKESMFDKRILKHCIKNTAIYKSYILSNTVKDLYSHFTDTSQMDKLNKFIEKNKDIMVRNDIQTLNTYTDISNISHSIIPLCNSLLKQDVSTIYAKCYFGPDRRNTILADIAQFRKVYDRFKKILPYIDQIYTIYSRGLETEYTQFLNNFKTSPQFKEYITFCHLILRTARWVQSLEEDLKIYSL